MGKKGINKGKKSNLGDKHTMQCVDNLSLSCILETCMVFLTNVSPINSIKINFKKICNISID